MAKTKAFNMAELIRHLNYNATNDTLEVGFWHSSIPNGIGEVGSELYRATPTLTGTVIL